MNRMLIDVLTYMIEDCEDIENAINRVGTIDNMDSDRPLRKAIVFSILNLGELTKLLEQHLDLTTTDINWKGLKGMREIAAHRYKSMDSIIIWDTCVNHIPKIHSFLKEKQKQYLHESE